MQQHRIPHLAFPLRVEGGVVATVEQNSIAEVKQSVLACLSTPLGSRDDAPEYGVRQGLFTRTPIRMAPILRAVEEQEPRASLLSESDFEDLVESVTVEVEATAA